MNKIVQYSYISQEQKRSKYVTHRVHPTPTLLLYTCKQSPKISSERLRSEKIKIEEKKENPPLKVNNNKTVSLKNENLNIQKRRIQSAAPTNRVRGKKKLARPNSTINIFNKRVLDFEKSKMIRPSTSKPKICCNDRYKPKNFEIYQKVTKDPKLYERSLSQIFSTKIIKNKNLSSQELYFEHQEDDNSIQQQNLYCPQLKSDIFFQKEKKATNISSQQNQFSTVFESNSQWAPQTKSNQLSMINHESIKYYIYNPGAKANNLTKIEIIEKTSKKNPNAKNQILGDFLNQTRNFANKENKEYLKFYNTNKNCFRKTKNICTSFGDLYGQYKPLCDFPFKKSKSFLIEDKI